MRRAILLLCFVFLPGFAWAKNASGPFLVSDLSRLYTAPGENWPEKTVTVDSAGSAMALSYTSDAPLTVKISYPFEKEDGTQSYNPLHTLILHDVPEADHGELTIDLTRSPAWSPSRGLYFLQVAGKAGSKVLIHDIRMKESTLPEIVAAAAYQLFIHEPMTLSVVNYLWGYRVLDVSFALLLGAVMVVLCLGFGFCRSLRWKKLFLVPLVFLLFYDARFSLDLLGLSLADARSWFSHGEYRQLGPVPAVVDFLREEAKKEDRMAVEVCSDGADLSQKQLRYMLYPVPVRRAGEEWEATHLVLVDTLKIPAEDGTVECGAGSRRVERLASFPHGAKVLRYADL
jgi:hypothetical protein